MVITKKMLINANKFAYLIKVYPEKTVPEIIGLFALPPVDINCAVWAALDLKFVREMGPETNFSEIIKPPKEWDFGQEVDDLEDELIYAFKKLNADEKDMEENYLANWTSGYHPHDALIAIKHLLEDDVLHEYEIEDGESKYIFYTLKKNAGKNWGAKQFKENPLTGEQNEESDSESDKTASKQLLAKDRLQNIERRTEGNQTLLQR